MSYQGDAIDGQPGAPGMLADSLRARRVILAVDLAFNVGNIAAYPAHLRHVSENRDRAPGNGVEILPRERRDRPFNNVTRHWLLLHHGSNLFEALPHALLAGRVRQQATQL
jgi:hypothetical protein